VVEAEGSLFMAIRQNRVINGIFLCLLCFNGACNSEDPGTADTNEGATELAGGSAAVAGMGPAGAPAAGSGQSGGSATIAGGPEGGSAAIAGGPEGGSAAIAGQSGGDAGKAGQAGGPDQSGTGGISGQGGTSEQGGTGGTVTGSTGGSAPPVSCCSDGDCICRGEDPTESSCKNGPYQTDSYVMPNPDGYGAGMVYYPTDADPPLAGAVAFAPYLYNSDTALANWGPFLASWGIVLQTTDPITPADPVDSRAPQLEAAIKQFRGENTRQDSPLYGKMSDRIGSMGYSMGGGANWIVASQDPTLKSAISLAGHNATSLTAQTCSANTTVPSMMLYGTLDTAMLGGGGQAEGVYALIPETTPKLLYVTTGVGHMVYDGPEAASCNVGEVVLAFQKTFLDNDSRWKKFLLVKPDDAAGYETNIK